MFCGGASYTSEGTSHTFGEWKTDRNLRIQDYGQSARSLGHVIPKIYTQRNSKKCLSLGVGHYIFPRLNSLLSPLQLYIYRTSQLPLNIIIISHSLGFLVIAPCSAGKRAPFGGLFLCLKSSQMSSIFTHFTPGLLLIYSINLSSMNMTCGCPLTSG